MRLQDNWIEWDGNRFSLDEIKRGSHPDSLNSYYQQALHVCHDWLNGKSKFELTTSGSTGIPKNIEVKRDQLIASAQLSSLALGLQKNFTSLVCLDIRYIAGMMMMVRSLEVGMNMIMTTPSSNPLEKIEEGCTIDFTALVPLQLEAILSSPQKEKLNQIKIAIIGGAAINKKTINAIQKMSCQFYATYGMTETLSHIALQKLNGNSAQNYFQALPGISLVHDERGCLVIDAPHLGEKLIVTNDLIEFISPTQFRWLGRVDTIINSGGVKVIPEKIETTVELILDEMNISTRFFVAGLPDVRLGQSVNLYVEGSPFSEKTEALIQNKLRDLLEKYECPRSIKYITHFINTETGKINRVKTLASLQQ